MIDSLLRLSLKNFYTGISFVLVVIFLVHYLVAGQAVYGDGVGYYAHLHTWVFDSDWDYSNEYRHIYSPENNNVLHSRSADSVQIVATTKDGSAANHFFPGTAVLLLPFYVIADWVVRISQLFNFPLVRNGYSDIYQIFSGLASILYVVAGLVFLEKLLIQLFAQKGIARLTVISILLATPLLYYGSYDVINSHGISFFLSTLFFYFLLTKKSFSVFILAVVAAAALMTRLQDGVLIVVYVLQRMLEVAQKKNSWTVAFKEIMLFFGLFFITLLPLYIYWYETFGSFVQHTYVQAFIREREADTSINWVGSFFDLRNGLFIKSPLLFILLIWYGYYCFKHKKILYWQLLLFFLLQIIIISLQGGWRAAAYGGRMYISSLPFFAVIVTAWMNSIKRNDYMKIILLIGVCVIINIFSLFHFVLFAKEAEQGTTGTEIRTQERIKNFLR